MSATFTNRNRKAPAAPAKPDRDFSARLIRWQRRHGRSGLPWQGTRDAYRIWLSEIMLQQTQVATVIPYYERFLAKFPDVLSLARAEQDEVLQLWAGLGYYSRARNLHDAARMIASDYRGVFPRSREALQDLPGVGQSTAAAIAAFAYGQKEAILDGNVRRVLSRHFAIRSVVGDSRATAKLWKLAESLVPSRGIERYTQALMDLGATVCTRSKPACAICPLESSCRALAMGRVAAFPSPRPRRQPPVRATAMLLLVHAGQVLLQKRPPSGIWGGLWSLPEIPFDDDAVAHCAARFGFEVERVADFAQLRHSFTHFTLDIRALRCDVSRLAPQAHEGGSIWLDVDEALGAAVPAPVKTLIVRLAAASSPGAWKGRRVQKRPKETPITSSPRKRGSSDFR